MKGRHGLLLGLLLLFVGCGTGGDRNPDRFIDMSESAGIRAAHITGIEVNGKHMFEAHIGGAGWIDHDSDGLLDLYLVNGHTNTEYADRPGPEANVLWRNRGDGTFIEVTREAGLDDHNYGCGMSVGDYDEDGLDDLYVTNFGDNVLYRNEGNGRFRDVTDDAGVRGHGWCSSSVFFDYDLDGDLDLYVCGYVKYHPRRSKRCREGNVLVYCGPREFPGEPGMLFRNEGDGTFTDVSEGAGIAVAGPDKGKSLGVIATDYNEDGFPDLYVANDGVPNFLWRNDRDGTFTDVGLRTGTAYSEAGFAQAGMGVDQGDLNGDGHIDIMAINFSHETNVLYLNEGDGFFRDGTQASGLGSPSYLRLGFGIRMFDHDLDGDLDVYIANGHVTDNVEMISPGSGVEYAEPDFLFDNLGDGTLKDISEQSGRWFRVKLVGRAASGADYDNDGDLDLFIVNSGQRCVLLRNDTPRRGSHFICIKLIGTKSNRNGYGARVEVRSGSKTQVFECQSTRSYMAANDPRIHVGLGKATKVEEVVILWPSGVRQVVRDLPGDRFHEIRESGRRPVKESSRGVP